MSQPRESKEFELLTLDYTMTREDERTFHNIQAAIVGLTVALLGAVASVVGNTCQLKKTKGCSTPPDLFLASAPAIPLASLAFMQLLGVAAALRSYYLRAVEAELRTYADAPLSSLTTLGPILPPSYSGLMTEVTTMRRGRSGYRILATMIMIIALFFFGGLTVYIAIHLKVIYTICMLLVYGGAFGILVADVAAATYGAGSTFIRIAGRFISRQHAPIIRTAADSMTGRPLASYFILPRPDDLIKWLFIPTSFIVVSWTLGEGFSWSRMVLTLFVVEYLIYSARYQWNDLRGMEDDASHPEVAARRRLPRVNDASQKRLVVTSSLIVLLLRLIGAAIIGYKMHALQSVLIFSGALFFIASIYEWLRSVSPVSPGDFIRRGSPAGQKLPLFAIWLTVGFGYSLRFLAGSYAANAHLRVPLVGVGMAFSFFFGVMFVLLTWVLEATSYCRKVTDGIWEAGSGLQQKPHVALLADYLKMPVVQPVDQNFRPDEQCGRKAILKDSRCYIFWSPWNVFYWVATVCGSILAAYLTALHDNMSLFTEIAMIEVGAAVCISYSSRSRGDGRLEHPIMLQVFIILGIGGCSIYWSTQLGQEGLTPDAGLIFLPWFMATMTYVGFRQQSYKDLKEFPERIADMAKGAGCGIAKLVLGPQVHGAICRRSSLSRYGA